MSKRSDLNARIHTLGEIKSILSAMKNLSIIEINKVSRFLGAQNELARTVDEAMSDYEEFFGPHVAATSPEMLYVLLGSERGFCGGFNEAILERFAKVTREDASQTKVIVVGRKLAAKLEGISGAVQVLEAIDGPSAAEEIANSISELARCLGRFPKMQWTLIHQEDGGTQAQTAAVCPFASRRAARTRKEGFPPLLNLSPPDLYPQLHEQYLFSVLYRAFYISFLAENHQRLRHMDGALNALERDWNRMRRLSNTLRQEEITEELEIIMLSAEA